MKTPEQVARSVFDEQWDKVGTVKIMEAAIKADRENIAGYLRRKEGWSGGIDVGDVMGEMGVHL